MLISVLCCVGVGVVLLVVVFGCDSVLLRLFFCFVEYFLECAHAYQDGLFVNAHVFY